MNLSNRRAVFPALDDARAPMNVVAGSDRSPLRQYWALALRWKRLIVSTIVVFLILGLVGTLLMTPQYTAMALIEIAREGNRISPVQGVEREATDTDLEFYQTQYGLLQSRDLAQRVVDRLKLADDPKFFAMFGKEPEGSPSVAADSGTLPIAGRAMRRRQAGTILLDHLSINPVRLSRLINVSFTSPDAAFSQKVVNAWTTNFIGTTLERRYEATSYARNFLENRLRQLRQRVEEADRQLVQYAMRERIIDIPATGNNSSAANRSIIAENLAARNASLNEARADRIKQEARARTSGGGAVSEALDNSAISGLREKRASLAADYQRMMVQFEPDYPAAKAIQSQIQQLDRSIAREETRVSQTLTNNFRDSAVREETLASDVKSLESALLDQRRRSIQYNIYQREADTNRQLYDALLQRYKEIGVASGVGVNNIAVVDPADLPVKPSSPRLLLNMILALLAGIGAGAALAFVMNQLADSLDDPEQIERELNVPLLGTVPRTTGDVTPAEALLDRKSHLVEAYLSIETALRFATDHGVPQTLSVTSTRSGEGKSTTSLSLAALLARAGKRVVLVDGDMRSPSVHGLVNVRNEAGLSSYLSGTEDLAGLLQRSDSFGLTVLAAGPPPPSAAELLASDRLPMLLTTLLRDFDHVIIDSPPVMGLADAPLIGSRVEGVVFAVESHGIRSATVRVALSRLRAAHVRIVGSVLTKFDKGRSHLGYGYDYGYSYGREDKRASA